MKQLLVAILILLLTACEKPAPVVDNTNTNTNTSTETKLFTIIDVRKSGECEDQTLMERDDKFRISRCGYFGKVGDQLIFVE